MYVRCTHAKETLRINSKCQNNYYFFLCFVFQLSKIYLDAKLHNGHEKSMQIFVLNTIFRDTVS